MNTIKLITRNRNEINDYEGLVEHAECAAIILNKRGINSHSKHHIREAVREMTNKTTHRKGGGKKTMDYKSKAVQAAQEAGETEGFVMEHVVTVSYINGLVLEKFVANGNTITAEEIIEIVLKWTIRALVTVEEDLRLRPTNKIKDFQNPGIRYEMANPPIELIPC